MGLRCADFGREDTNQVFVRQTISIQLSRECIVLGGPATPIEILFIINRVYQVLKDVYVGDMLLNAFYMRKPKLSWQIVAH